MAQRTAGADLLRRQTSCRRTRRSAQKWSLGAYPFTAANESNATTINDIILELLTTQRSERSGRLIDTEQEAAMEMRKREGYF